MIINGYKLQRAIRELESRRESVVTRFQDAFHKFDDEEKPRPTELSEEYKAIEESIATLLTARAKYNLSVEITVNGQKMPLAKAIRLVGGAGRLEKLWRGPANIKHDRWDRSARLTRDADEERAKRTMRPDECLEEAKKEGNHAAALREAIAVGNGTEMEMELGPELFC